MASFHNTNGPVQATFPDGMYGGPENPAFIQSVMNLTGMEYCEDLNGGMPNCATLVPHVRFTIRLSLWPKDRRLFLLSLEHRLASRGSSLVVY